MKTIEWTEPHTRYRGVRYVKGDRVDLPDDEAEQQVAFQIAKFVEPAPKAAPKEAPATP